MSIVDEPSTVVLTTKASGRSEVTIELERNIDVERTAELLDRSFPHGYQRDGAYLDWLYNRSSGRRAIVVAARKNGAKVGQMVFIPHEIDVDGQPALLGLTVDFFVLPEHRTPPLVIQLTRRAIDVCRDQGLDGIVGVPNSKSLPIVARFMKTRQTRKLGLRAGFAWPVRRQSVDTSISSRALDDASLKELLEPYVRSTSNARMWSAETLLHRLRSPVTDFGLHLCADALAISCRFAIKGLDFTMLCGFLSRTAAPVGPDIVTALVNAACQLQGRPNFCYVGVNSHLERLPGIAISERLHSSPLTVVARMLPGHLSTFTPDRYEMIDFDMV